MLTSPKLSVWEIKTVLVWKINISLSVTCYEGDKRCVYLFIAIPTFVIRSLTASLTIFVCFHGSEKSGLSGSEKSHVTTKWPVCNVLANSSHFYFLMYG